MNDVSVIRLAHTDDAGQLCEIYSPFVLNTWVSFEDEPPAPEEMARRIDAATCWLVLEQAGGLEGYACAVPFRSRRAYQWSVEVSVYIHEERRRRGAGRALYEALFSCLRLMGYHKSIAIVALPNPPSVALHERLGFSAVGVFHEVGYKMGAWRDVGWWELTLAESAGVPAPPRHWKKLCNTASWKRALARTAADLSD